MHPVDVHADDNRIDAVMTEALQRFLGLSFFEFAVRHENEDTAG